MYETTVRLDKAWTICTFRKINCALYVVMHIVILYNRFQKPYLIQQTNTMHCKDEYCCQRHIQGTVGEEFQIKQKTSTHWRLNKNNKTKNRTEFYAFFFGENVGTLIWISRKFAPGVRLTTSSIGSGNNLVSSSNKTYSDPMLSRMYDAK